MTCVVCAREFHLCICDDFDERFADLRQCQFLDQNMLDQVAALRLLAKFEIEEDRAKSKQQPHEPH